MKDSLQLNELQGLSERELRDKLRGVLSHSVQGVFIETIIWLRNISNNPGDEKMRSQAQGFLDPLKSGYTENFNIGVAPFYHEMIGRFPELEAECDDLWQKLENMVTVEWTLENVTEARQAVDTLIQKVW